MAITLAAPHEFAAQYIADGAIKVEGFDVETAWDGGVVYPSAFRSPVYDVIILPLSNFLIAMDKGLPLVGLPVIIDSFFPQTAIRVNKNAGITTPKDLEGKRVGVRGFAFSPAVWVRGAMADVYGLDLTKVNWVVAEPNSLSGVDVPIGAGFNVEGGADLVADLESGKLDAVLWDRGGPKPTENTTTLFADPLAESLKYYQQSGVFPINSMLVAKRETLDANPGLAQAVVDAYDQAWVRYFTSVTDAVDFMGLPMKWLRSNGLAPLRNGLANNRKTFETVARYAHEQGIISRLPSVEELFFDGAS